MKKELLFLLVGLLWVSPAISQNLTLASCRQLADKHYQPLQLAEEEIAVRQAKSAEAARALWPGLNIKGEFTDGASIVELGTPGFREASYGVQLTQTLFSGGKLWSTYQQAVINQQIAEKKLQKARLEMNHQLLEAYWNLVRVSDNQVHYSQSVKDSEQYVAMANKLFEDGAIKKRTLIAAKTHRNSAAYQEQSADADIEKFKWNLAAAMGLDEPKDWQLQKSIPYYASQVTLEQCLEEAEKHNPDYLQQQLSLKAALYEKHIQQSLDWPKIELNGFYGRSGGAYDSEDLKLNEDYNISIKLTQNFAWNSLALSGFEQKTSPKLGQSTRTESKTASAAFGLLDGYKSAAEKKEAGWQYRQAKYNEEKARQTMMVEVREAFFNVKKGYSQVENAELEVELAKSELAIQKIHLKDEKVSVADVAEAGNKLANAAASLNEAKVFYLLALSALDKAVGIEGYSTKK